MRYFTPSALRASVSSIAAVAVISLFGWSFESYTGYLHQQSRGATAAFHTSTTGDVESRQV
jgi:hypothetical protein